MTTELRSISTPAPRYPVVTKAGIIKTCAVASNIGGALELYNGKIKISRSHEDEDWVLLEDLYRREGRMDDWAVYESWRAAKAQGVQAGPFPDEFLPQEVLARRAGQVPGKKTWTPPVKSKPVKPKPDESRPEHKGDARKPSGS